MIETWLAGGPARRFSRNNALSVSDQLLIALRFYATCSMQQVVGDINRIHKASVCRAIHRVSRAIAALAPRYIYMPRDMDEISEVCNDFYRIAQFPRVIGAIDCTHIPIQSPGTEHAELYRCRKDFFSLNVQTVVDAKLRIMDIVCRWPGSVHDSTIFDNSYIKERLENGEFGNRNSICHLWLLGCTTVLLVMGSDGAEITCPDECSCRTIFNTEDGNSLRVLCTRGNMRAVPIDFLDKNAHVLVISAPPENPNFLNIGPIFTQPVPFANLRELHIVNSNVPSIGKYSFWGLQNLRLINLTHNNLSSIDADNFRGLINLTELHLDHNNIKQMPSETFMHLTALKTLIISNNKISTLVPRLFRMLAKLSTLDLSDNPLDDLNPEVFKDIQHLRFFRCRRCLLRRVNTQIYHLVPHLEELDLGENQFKYLTSDEFISLKKLKKLRLDGNQLSVIVDNMFGRNRELRALSLARNRLALLAPAALTNLTALVHLDISHNKIDRFHLQTFAPVVESLKTINFSGNNLPLNEIAIVLQILPDIHGIGLANLSLELIPPNFFTYNEHLVGLDISWNKLTEFPYKLLTKTKFLQRLDISHNNLQTLTEQDLQRLEAIAQISLSKNKWRCDQCSAGTMLVYMTTTVLNGTIRNLKCYSPMRLRGVSFAEMTFNRLEQCPSTHEAQMSVIAGLMLLCVAVLAAVAGALCCTRRRAAHYYTNEEKRREHEHEHPEELLGRTELGSVATIHAPYQLVSKGS